MAATSPSYYECRACHWCAETDHLPERCERCRSEQVVELDADTFVDRLDRGVIGDCAACRRIHTR